ncbi:unnamed protein product [Clavelina lepadiformis]|uniref:Uncharacterized protein n=1 Tax=Clavelina lepadiformis TaxID=159417 RepID=A0ABP0GDI6_CLALP
MFLGGAGYRSRYLAHAKRALYHLSYTPSQQNCFHIDEVAEWLWRWTANPLCSARVGSSPILVGWGSSSVVERTLRMREAPDCFHIDEVAEWLRRWTANPLCSARVGSSPILVGWGCCSVVERTLRMCEAPGSIPGISRNLIKLHFMFVKA